MSSQRIAAPVTLFHFPRIVYNGLLAQSVYARHYSAQTHHDNFIWNEIGQL
jgi:hypothetical protein